MADKKEFIELDAGFGAKMTVRKIGDNALTICIMDYDNEGIEQSKSCAYFKDAISFFSEINQLKPVTYHKSSWYNYRA